jgi:hypothetical protein
MADGDERVAGVQQMKAPGAPFGDEPVTPGAGGANRTCI